MIELSNPEVLIGYLAAALVFTSFYMKTMLPLRLVAVASNLAFILYGYLYELTPILMLHFLLLPLNLTRTWQIRRAMQRIRETRSKGLPLEVILPSMTKSRRKAGETLFSQGDDADRLYVLTEGEIELIELGVTIGPGSLCGEVGLFSSSHRRMATAVCRSDVVVYFLTSDQVDAMYYQNPDFGYALLGILTNRLIENSERLQTKLKNLGQER